MKVAVVDYGMGNVLSVARAITQCGAKAVITSNKAQIQSADGLILPGVGAFGAAMAEISKRELEEPIVNFAKSGRPLLGICLGMQILASEGHEFGLNKGLGLIKGSVEKMKFDQDTHQIKIPNIGWYEVEISDQLKKLNNKNIQTSLNTHFYFIHSYHFLTQSSDDILASYRLGTTSVTAVVGNNNILGTQFHPEKSGPSGLELLSKFLNL